MRIEWIAFHASLADGLVARVGTISGGTPEQIASSAERSSWKSTSSSSTASQRWRVSIFNFISSDHE